MVHHLLERTGQVLRYFDPYVLVVNTGLIVYAIIGTNRGCNTGIHIILRDTPCLSARYSVGSMVPTSLCHARIARTYINNIHK